MSVRYLQDHQPVDRLTRKELRHLIGTPGRARQAAWLDAHGWPYELDCMGCPIVLRSVALARLGEAVAQPWVLNTENVA